MGNVEFDQHGHIRLAEIDLGGMLKDQLKSGLKDFGIDTTVVHKNIGYELRSLEPIPFDIEYTKDLGFSAATYLLEGKSGDMTSIQNGRLVPLSFEEMIDPNTGRPKIRMVDVNTLSYEVGYEYMIRLKKDDFLNPESLTSLAKVINVSPVEFKKRFGYLVGL
jgi:6-phosphofructokinase 1